MLSEAKSRHEKNRCHLVSSVVVLFAIPMHFLLYLALPSSRWIVFVGTGLSAVVLAIRTFFIEIGLRRPPSLLEKTLESRYRGFLYNAFGIRFVEDSRSRLEQRGN